MAYICSCDEYIQNFGQPSCIPSSGKPVKLIFVKYRTNAGAVNSIPAGTTFDNTFFNGKIGGNNDVRWHITPTIKTVEDVREEVVTQDIEGFQYSVRDGIRNFAGTFYGSVASPTFEGVLRSLGCEEMGYFQIDLKGNIIGDGSVAGELRPFLIERSTFKTLYKPATDTEVQNIMFSFSLSNLMLDQNIKFIPSTGMAVNPLSLEALKTINSNTPSAVTVNGFTIDLSFIYGTAFVGVPLVGFEAGDFVTTNNTTPGVVAKTLTETPDGTYIFAFTSAQTLADSITLTLVKTGFEMAPVTFVI
jgi:hypothetical protein